MTNDPTKILNVTSERLELLAGELERGAPTARTTTSALGAVRGLLALIEDEKHRARLVREAEAEYEHNREQQKGNRP